MSTRPPTFTTRARHLAARVDQLPVMPARFGGILLGLHYDRRQRAAATDPEWAAIEDRRTNHDSPHKTLLSSDLTWDDLDRQNAIADRLTPRPAWVPAASVLSQCTLVSVVDTIARITQRAHRGWADSDTWNLGYRLAENLGAQLLHLAGTAHGWPADSEFPTYEDWTGALTEHGRALVEYAASSGEASDETEAVLLDRAQTALHWAADHLGNLWD